MLQKRASTLITSGKIAAHYSFSGCNIYNASKAAIRRLVLGMADEIESFGIRHCLLELGFFRTGLLELGANMMVANATSCIPDYEEVNKTAAGTLAAFHGNQAGDPVKCAASK
jgi:NADP-dependent 3-hydroxy acid dehydrogenase YdfG